MSIRLGVRENQAGESFLGDADSVGYILFYCGVSKFRLIFWVGEKRYNRLDDVDRLDIIAHSKPTDPQKRL